MIKFKISFAVLLFLCFFFISQAQSKKILVHTNYGDFKVLLYDYTAHHKQLLLDAIQSGVYTNAQFNRVISDFVVQGGELDEDILSEEAKSPSKPPVRLAPEFDTRAFHKIGALGAGRDDNPTKSSFLNQLYFVVGKKVTVQDLDALEKKKGIVYSKEQREEYLKNGGQPRLDHDYTVFGEIYEGLDVIMKISKVKTSSADLPVDKVTFSLTVIE
ncbi:peptidylprolyl isomerase [Sphingobacterium spiritivorum]|uniref:peptidylprolyl isomerase n=1 Tax=Sphingobacterium spiritivorum TaxID=258 RepID=UPI003DA447BA